MNKKTILSGALANITRIKEKNTGIEVSNYSNSSKIIAV
jgi:hypothetical protein